MRNKRKYILWGIIATVISGGFIYNLNQNNNDKIKNLKDDKIIGIYKDDEDKFHSKRVTNKDNDSEYIAYIESNSFERDDKNINSEFKLNKFKFKNVSLEIPDFFQYISNNAQEDNTIQLVTNKKDINNPINKDNISISIIDNTTNETPESYLNFQKMISKDKTYNSPRSLKGSKIDGESLMLYYDVKYDKDITKNGELNIKLYNKIIFKGDKIYSIEYCYEDEEVGKKVIEAIESSLKIS